MSKSTKRPPTFSECFPALSEGELQNLERYFDIALEIAEQDSIEAEAGFDIAPSMATLKERSNSNLKDQS